MVKKGLVLVIAAIMFAALAGAWPLAFGKGDALPINVSYATPSDLAYAASKEIRIQLNGQPVQFDVQPQIIDGRTYVPFRKLLEALGASVTWDQGKETATAMKDGLSVAIPLGSKIITMQGHNLTMDVPVVLVNDRTLVPLRFVGQALGAKVTWVPGDTADQIEITQSYADMIEQMVTGVSGDQKVSYEQAAILFEWLYKGQEKWELPGFTGTKASNGYPFVERGDDYIEYWFRVVPNGGAYSKITRELYTKIYRIVENGIFEESTKKKISSYISIADQTQRQYDLPKGEFIKGYYPER